MASRLQPRDEGRGPRAPFAFPPGGAASALLLALALGAAVPLAAAQAPPADPDPAGVAAYREGERAVDAGDDAAAAAAFARALELIPDDSRIAMKLGLARAALQDWDGALEAYRRVLSLDPGSAAAYNNIGNIHFRRGDHEAAALSYREALKINPGYILAAYNLGWTARQLNHPEEAEREFRRCLTLAPSTPQEVQLLHEARFYLGALRFRAGDYEGCLELLRRVVADQPEHDRAHYYIGQSLLRLGQREEAQRELALHQKLADDTPSGGTVATAKGP